MLNFLKGKIKDYEIRHPEVFSSSLSTGSSSSLLPVITDTAATPVSTRTYTTTTSLEQDPSFLGDNTVAKYVKLVARAREDPSEGPWIPIRQGGQLDPNEKLRVNAARTGRIKYHR